MTGKRFKNKKLQSIAGGNSILNILFACNLLLHTSLFPAFFKYTAFYAECLDFLLQTLPLDVQTPRSF